MDGWVKLHRCLIDKAIWKRSQPEQKAVLITILCIANHEPNEWIWDGKKYIVESGQFITSLESLAKKSGVSIRSVRTALANFEKLEFLTSKSTKTGRLITVVNWALYQHQENKSTNKSTNDRQTTDKEPTSSTDGVSPQGNLAAIGTASIHGHGFTKSFVEHCVILGFGSVS